MIRCCVKSDFETIHEVINDAAQAYRGEVTLIRHAYVRTRLQGQGIGTALLRRLEEMTDKPILIGTWADATWAVSFYRKNGYEIVTEREKDLLLKRYWRIPDRQVETSVVLADAAAMRELSAGQLATPA